MVLVYLCHLTFFEHVIRLNLSVLFLLRRLLRLLLDELGMVVQSLRQQLLLLLNLLVKLSYFLWVKTHFSCVLVLHLLLLILLHLLILILLHHIWLLWMHLLLWLLKVVRYRSLLLLLRYLFFIYFYFWGQIRFLWSELFFLRVVFFRSQDILLVVYLIWINCGDRVDGGHVIYVQIWGV